MSVSGLDSADETSVSFPITSNGCSEQTNGWLLSVVYRSAQLRDDNQGAGLSRARLISVRVKFFSSRCFSLSSLNVFSLYLTVSNFRSEFEESGEGSRTFSISNIRVALATRRIWSRASKDLRRIMSINRNRKSL